MPAAKKSGGGQWGITWQEVADSVADYEEFYACRVEHVVLYTRPSHTALSRVWTVHCTATRGRDGAYRIQGYAACQVGHKRGASSFPGAFIRSLIDACEDLTRKVNDKKQDRDNPAPEGYRWWNREEP